MKTQNQCWKKPPFPKNKKEKEEGPSIAKTLLPPPSSKNSPSSRPPFWKYTNPSPNRSPTPFSSKATMTKIYTTSIRSTIIYWELRPQTNLNCWRSSNWRNMNNCWVNLSWNLPGTLQNKYRSELGSCWWWGTSNIQLKAVPERSVWLKCRHSGGDSNKNSSLRFYSMWWWELCSGITGITICWPPMNHDAHIVNHYFQTLSKKTLPSPTTPSLTISSALIIMFKNPKLSLRWSVTGKSNYFL